MMPLQTSVASALTNAGVAFTGGGNWLRLKGEHNAISVNAQSGGWRDHRTGEHGNFAALGQKLHFDGDGIIIDATAIQNSKKSQEQADKRSTQWAKTQWARAIPAVKPPRPSGWSQAAWDREQEQYQDYREAVYDYLLSRGLDPAPLLPLIKIQTQLNPKYKDNKPDNVDAEMVDAGADLAFMVPMYAVGLSECYETMVGVQRAFLKFPQDKYERVSKIGRAMLGKLGMTRLEPSGSPVALPVASRVMANGEGFETVASYVQTMRRPGYVCWTWQTLRTWSQNIHKLLDQVTNPDQAPTFAILVDYDTSQVGQKESAAAYHRVMAHKYGKAVYLLPPESIIPNDKGNRDWNDLLAQSPDDFAAEIIKSWHNSDANLKAAPEPDDEPVVSNIGYKGPKEADVAQAVADAVELFVASEKMQLAITKYEQNYKAYLSDLEKWKAEKSGKKPKLPPLLIKVTTGVGKSHYIKGLIETTELPVLILTRTHELAGEYDKEDAFTYHGRSAPSEDAVPEKDDAGYPMDPKHIVYSMKHVVKNQKLFKQSDCFKIETIETVAENNHIPALTACRNCEHGRKFMILNYHPQSKPYQAAWDWFDNEGINPSSIPPCFWLGQQAKIKRTRVVVAPNAAFSETLAHFEREDGSIVPRLVIVDEIPELSKDVDVHTGSLGEHVFLAQKSIEYFQRASTTDPDKDKIINDLNIAVGILSDMSDFLGKSVGKGVEKVPDDIVQRIQKWNVDWLPGATARWEKADIRHGRAYFVPLRMTRALIDSISTRTAFVNNGFLGIREISALGEHLRKAKPAIYLDATPTDVVESIIEKKGGEIVHAIAQQHIKVVHYNQYLHGKSWKNQKHKQAELSSLLSLREQMEKENGKKPNVLTHMELCDIAEAKADDDWGYFGRDDIGQDRWKEKDLLIFGGSLFGPTTQAKIYNSGLMLLRLAGIEAPDWSDDVERNQEITVGNKVITSKAPLPTDPYLRNWVLSDYGRRTAQAIGRVRGARNPNPDAPINVWIAGGLPLAGLAEHGIEVSEYRQERLVNQNDEAQKTATQKVEVAIASLQAADQEPSYRAVNQWLTEHGLPAVRYNLWKSNINELSTTLNKDTYEAVDNLLASLNSLQKVANWQEMDISDAALNAWNAPGIDADIRAAAEIILQVSPYSHKWRDDHPS